MEFNDFSLASVALWLNELKTTRRNLSNSCTFTEVATILRKFCNRQRRVPGLRAPQRSGTATALGAEYPEGGQIQGEL